jgi:hypothetical protein
VYLRTAKPKPADRKFCIFYLRIPETNCGPQFTYLRTANFVCRTRELQSIIAVRKFQNYGPQLCPAAPFQPFFFSKPSLHLPHPSNSFKTENTSSHPTHTTSSSTLSTTSISSSPQPLLDLSSHFLSSTLTLLFSQNPRCAPTPNPPSPYHHSHSPACKTPKSPDLAPVFAVRNPKTSVRQLFYQNPNRPHTSHTRHACQENIRWA